MIFDRLLVLLSMVALACVGATAVAAFLDQGAVLEESGPRG